MPLEIVGAGFGRTGTDSLRLALEQLGFGPCHHMREVVVYPEQVAHWAAAAEGRTVDWEVVFAGYRSQVDWPGARYWRELAAAFPQAKVILTVRPADAWFRSFAATIGRGLWSPPRSDDPVDVARRTMQRRTIAEQTFGDRIDETHAIDVFKAHIAEVRASIAPDRLLVFDVAERWQPLCAFLGVAVPETPFPRSNTTEEFLGRA